MRRSTFGIFVSLFLMSVPGIASADNFILYLQGRGDGIWRYAQVQMPGWTNVPFGYDGSAPLGDPFVSDIIEQRFVAHCSGANACIIACHSAGCMRTLKAVDALEARGVALNILWVSAASSAAGGTRLAELSTNLFGAQPIDEDIRRDRARAATGWGFLQDAMRNTKMHHIAGNRDACSGFVCGNWVLPGGICDGMLCVDSAGGASITGAFDNACVLPRYPGRTYDTAHAGCFGEGFNHSGMPDHVVRAVETDLRNGVVHRP